VRSPASLRIGPYQLELSWEGDSLELSWREAAVRRVPRIGLALLVSLLLIGALWLRLARAPSTMDDASGRTGLKACPAPSASPATAVNVQGAVALLRAGDRVAALSAYRALAARDDSRAEYAIVASLLARELSCQP
jgi:hypothetical protein